jgi:hypothetical protein
MPEGGLEVRLDVMSGLDWKVQKNAVHLYLIIPTLRVGMQPGTLRVPFESWNAERP